MADKTLHTRRWTDLPERGTPRMLRLIHWTATAVGRWAARLLLYPTTLYFVLSAHTARRMSYQYLSACAAVRPTGGMYFAIFIASPRPSSTESICLPALSSTSR